MKSLKYSIAITSFALLSASAASAANYVYGNTESVYDNRSMNRESNWFEVATFEGLTGYTGLTTVGNHETDFLPSAGDNLLVKNFNSSDFAGGVYNPAAPLSSASGDVYNIAEHSFGFPSTPGGTNLFEVNNLTISIDPTYVIGDSPTANPNDRNMLWRAGNGIPEGTGVAEGKIKINGTLALEKAARVNIQGNIESGYNWQFALIDINKLSITSDGGTSKLQFSDHIKEVRIGTVDNGSGVQIANGENSVVGNGSQFHVYVNENTGSDFYIGNFTAEQGSDMHLRGATFNFVGDTVFSGNAIVLHHDATTIKGDITFTNTSSFDFREGSFIGIARNAGGFSMASNENPTHNAIFNGQMINSGTFHFGRGIFTGDVENSGTLLLSRGDSCEALDVAKMMANIVNNGTMIARTDVAFKGSLQVNAGSSTEFQADAKGDFSNERVFLNDAKIYASGDSRLTFNNTQVVYNLASGSGASMLEVAGVANIDALSDIIATDFAFMNISGGQFDLIKFNDGNMYSSLIALIGSTFEYVDAATFDLYEGTFFENGSGVFAIEFVLIPEPSTYAAIFGILALALAAYRRRK